MSADQQPRERKGPEYVRYVDHVAVRRKYVPIVKKVGLSLAVVAVATAAAFIAVPQMSGTSAVNRVLSALENGPPVKMTTVIYDGKGGKMREFTDYVHGQSWRGDFDGGRRIHVQTPLFKYVYEKDQNILRTYTADGILGDPLTQLRANLQTFQAWGKGSKFKTLSASRYQFEIPGKRYTLRTDSKDLPTLLSIEMDTENGFTKAAEVTFDFSGAVDPRIFTPDVPKDATKLDMQQASVRDVTKLSPVAHVGEDEDSVGLIQFDISKAGNVFVLIRSTQIRVEVGDELGNSYVMDPSHIRTWNYADGGRSRYFSSLAFVPVDGAPWSPRKYKVTFERANSSAIGTLDIDVPKPTCDVAPTYSLGNTASASEYLDYDYKALKTRAKALKDLRIDEQGKIHLTTTMSANVPGQVLRQDQDALRRSIEIQKDIIRVSMFHVPQSNIVRANAYSQIYDVYRYNLGMSAEAKKALNLTFEVFKLTPERLRDYIDAQDARSVLAEEGLLDLLNQ